jgi:hypothetical protein
MFEVIRLYKQIISKVAIARFETNGHNLFLKASITFCDGSTLHLRQAVINGVLLKYAYHWENRDGKLVRRWDNADHWPEISTKPHHCHVDNPENVVESQEAGDLTAVIAFIASKVHLL